MKLNAKILKLARQHFDQHLVSDLSYTEELYRFMQDGIDIHTYLSSEFGFKKFLNDYGVVRTLKGGDEAKLQVLNVIREFQFLKSHVLNIATLAKAIQSGGLSSHSGLGGAGLPQSFCSKFLYLYKPDELIPYDSYVLKSLHIRSGTSPKDLAQYYKAADNFRLMFFGEKSDEIREIIRKKDKQLIARIRKLGFSPDKLFSWKLTDKYLWCEEFVRRSNAARRKLK